MSRAPDIDTPQEAAAMNDYRTRIWTAFQDLYEDKWNQSKWDAAVADFKSRHSPAVIEALRAKKLLPPWEALEAQLKKGPPPFLRPGWTSPLLGKRVDLDWIDEDASFVSIRGNKAGWRDAKILVIEFWATWCRPCHRVFPHLSNIANRPGMKVISYNHEGIFNNTETNIPAVKNFVLSRQDMNFPIFVDVKRLAINSLFKPGKNISIPLVFIITPRDKTIRWIGNAEEMEAPLANIVAAV
ncbi:hypothetical protein NM688_g3053 [Phlebia brevispora]|uniref:Uncharacterized protein n=1 Tax=Phlebia brevispora TaxID=194682 RepID=A0ACC1T6S2_9APHY|nr:hypothetical protein NM688_g3053 [Phlebia brevispora]